MSRYPILKDTKITTFHASLTDLAAAESIRLERDITTLAPVLRDALHVGVASRLPLARAIYMLSRLDEDDGDVLRVGVSPEEVARHRLIRELMDLYGDLVLGRMPEPEPEAGLDPLMTAEQITLRQVLDQPVSSGPDRQPNSPVSPTTLDRFAARQRLQQIDQQRMVTERLETRRRLVELERQAREAERRTLITELVRIDLELPDQDIGQAFDTLARLLTEVD